MVEGLLATAVGIAVFAVLWLSLRRFDIEVTPAMIGATFPWFGVVGAAYAVQEGLTVPRAIEPFIRTPTAYFTVGVAVLVLWVAVDRIRPGRQAAVTAVSGGVLATSAVIGISIAQFGTGWAVVGWTGIAVVLAVSITALVRRLSGFDRRAVPVVWLNWSVVFAHVLDATTTGIGLEVFGTVERNPVSASIISIGDAVGVSGAGTAVFLLVKIVAALLVVSLASGSTEDERERWTLLVVAGGVGLAPAVHNIVLFLLTVQ